MSYRDTINKVVDTNLNEMMKTFQELMGEQGRDEFLKSVGRYYRVSTSNAKENLSDAEEKALSDKIKKAFQQNSPTGS